MIISSIKKPHRDSVWKISSEKMPNLKARRDPSRGGMGIKLNTAKKEFKIIPNAKNFIKPKFSGRAELKSPISPINTNIMHSTIFIAGPANVMMISSIRRVLGLGREICTGLPQPIMPKPGLRKIITAGIKIVPIGSV